MQVSKIQEFVYQNTVINTIIKLKGKGVTHINYRGKGDQFVRIVVNVPKKLNKHQKNILDEFRKTSD